MSVTQYEVFRELLETYIFELDHELSIGDAPELRKRWMDKWNDAPSECE